VLSRMPVTLSVTFGSGVVALLIAIPAGTVAAIRADSPIDRIVTFGATLGVATPNFFLGLLLILFVALGTGLFPTSGYAPLGAGVGDWALHIVLPSIALGAAISAEIARHLRASLRDVLDQDYIRTARSKGLPAWKVVGKHGLKNAAIPVVTVLGLQITNLLSGSVVVEAVFGLPGLGNLLIRAVFSRDFPMIQGVMLITVLMVVVVNLLVDISYGYFNPKVRSS
jgi:peptide/nickel transport system permease protein